MRVTVLTVQGRGEGIVLARCSSRCGLWDLQGEWLFGSSYQMQGTVLASLLLFFSFSHCLLLDIGGRKAKTEDAP